LETETRYHPSADQLSLAGAIDESLDSVLPLSRLHTSYDESTDVWSSLDEIGIFAISASEEQGGSGLGATEEALIAMGLGRRLAAPSVFATIGAGQSQAISGSVAEVRGKRVAAAYRQGDRVIIVEDAKADLILVRGADSASLHEAASCVTKVIDRRLWLGRLLEGVRLGEPIASFGAAGLLRLRLIDAAALAGMAAATLDMGVAYAGLREQFGRPIGSFQAVKHHCANMAMASRCARDQTGFAAVAVDESRADAALQVESALFVAGTAAIENAGLNIQIHGGIGFSDEADPHLFLKRAQLQVAIAGGLEAANLRVANAKGVW
jgi:alkylation response protein AidB-like acyl-CoA dehydrogenase